MAEIAPADDRAFYGAAGALTENGLTDLYAEGADNDLGSGLLYGSDSTRRQFYGASGGEGAGQNNAAERFGL